MDRLKLHAHRNIEKVYSGINDLPSGSAPEGIIEGCAVLEGGAFRGVYGEGVLDALMQNGINMSCTIGVSAGAIIQVCRLRTAGSCGSFPRPLP